MPDHQTTPYLGDPCRLLDYLTTPCPSIELTNSGKSKSNRSHPHWLTPTKISTWEEFHTDALFKCYDGLFQEILNYRIEPTISVAALEGSDPLISEFGVEDALWYTRVIVRTALRRAQDQCESFSVPYVTWAKGSEASPGIKNPRPKRRSHTHLRPRRSSSKRSDGKWRPDWAGVRKAASSDDLPRNILPGETKISSNWESDHIKHLTEAWSDGAAPGWLRPLNQLFTYCMSFAVRYGYIITDKELVVCRVHLPSTSEPAGSSDLGDGWIEYHSVPFDCGEGENPPRTEGERRLTVHLALWWLHLLAVDSGALAVEYGPLADQVQHPPNPQPAQTPSLTVSIEGTPDVSLNPVSPITMASESAIVLSFDHSLRSSPAFDGRDMSSFNSNDTVGIAHIGGGRKKKRRTEEEPTRSRKGGEKKRRNDDSSDSS